MFVNKPSFWLTSLAGVFLLSSLLAVNVHAADDEDAAGREEKSAAGFEEQEVGTSKFTGSKVAELPYVLPNLYKRHLVSVFTLGQMVDAGIRSGDQITRDMYTELSASFAYNLQRKHSEYVFDYRAGGRRYNRLHVLDAVTHDLGLSQVVQLTPRLTWILDNRFSYTPDFSRTLVRENLASDASFFNNPVPPGGIRSISALINPFPEFHSAGDGLDSSLRSIRRTNTTAASLIHQLSARTSLSLGAGYHRERYSERALFESDSYNVSAGLSRIITARTSMGISYRGGRFDYASGSFGRTISHSAGISLDYQLTPSTIFRISGQPTWITTQGQTTILLSPVLANLLGRQALSRDNKQSFLSWAGAAVLSTRWHGLNFGLDYNRSVSNTNGIGGPAMNERLGVNLGKQLRQGTNLSVSVSYQRDKLLAIQDAQRLDQQALRGTLTQQLNRGLDLSLFFSYSRLLTEVPSSVGYNQNQFGMRFSYHFPRVSGS